MIDVIVVAVSLRDDIGDDGEAELRTQGLVTLNMNNTCVHLIERL